MYTPLALLSVLPRCIPWGIILGGGYTPFVSSISLTMPTVPCEPHISHTLSEPVLHGSWLNGQPSRRKWHVRNKVLHVLFRLSFGFDLCWLHGPFRFHLHVCG